MSHLRVDEKPTPGLGPGPCRPELGSVRLLSLVVCSDVRPHFRAVPRGRLLSRYFQAQSAAVVLRMGPGKLAAGRGGSSQGCRTAALSTRSAPVRAPAAPPVRARPWAVAGGRRRVWGRQAPGTHQLPFGEGTRGHEAGLSWLLPSALGEGRGSSERKSGS